MLKTIKGAIPMRWKVHLNSFHYKNNSTYKFSKNNPKVIVALAADYGNLGDVAITKAQVEFIKKAFPSHRIVEFPFHHTSKMLTMLKQSCGPKDIITLIGGGNMGDMYEGMEEARRTVISFFPHNKIISFPQTIDFSDSSSGKKSLSKSKNIYSKHPDLHIFSRENLTYERMKEYFPKNNVYLVPDIVLSLNKVEPKKIRKSITICLRDDQESTVSNTKKNLIIKSIEEKHGELKFYDTHIGDENFKKSDPDEELNKIWTAFKSSKVVITDRLHGMIFCAITKTPCIVLPNSNHKIAGTYYKWLEEAKYIHLIEEFDLEDINSKVDRLLKINLDEQPELIFKDKFHPLMSVLKG
ncbi:polysaccharide pyruvyl transferase family protein [Priestia megaterium]